MALTRLFNEVLFSGELPSDWGVSLLALLPKTKWPAGVSELRPIAMSSAAMKAMSRIIMARSFDAIRHPSPWSCAGRGRGCADMHGAMGRLRDMTREWRLGVLAVKLDIKGAFDNISRAAVADYLTQKVKEPFELRFLLQLLADNVLVGCAPGGASVHLQSNRGIRQGSPESAELFGLIVSQIITELKDGILWKKPGPPIADIPADVGCYQDDIFVWGENPRWISHNIKLIASELSKIGLSLACEKTAVISSKYYKGVRYLDVAGKRVDFLPAGSSLRVLGLDFDLDAPAHQQAKEIMGRVWSAFHSNKTVLCGVGSRREKASMVCKLIDGCWSWCAGALHWEAADLVAMNSIQLRIFRLCFGCKRLAREDWVSYNSRSLREVRLWLQQSGIERWSTKIVRLQFQIMGVFVPQTSRDPSLAHWVFNGNVPVLIVMGGNNFCQYLLQYVKLLAENVVEIGCVQLGSSVTLLTCWVYDFYMFAGDVFYMADRRLCFRVFDFCLRFKFGDLTYVQLYHDDQLFCGCGRL
ncbi:pol [Symbiodinium sp. CCMP2456]|nr:pol [Symbiodinium sp. CCMP2456]